MAIEHEIQFVGQYWHAAEHDDRVAWKAQALVDPTMFESDALASLYNLVNARHVAGKPLEYGPDFAADISEAGATHAAAQVSDTWYHHHTLMHFAGCIVQAWRARRQVTLIQGGLSDAKRAAAENPEDARRVAEKLSMRLLDAFAGDPSEERPQSRDELVDDQIDRIDREAETGVTLPWPKLQDACGPWMPGDVVGLTGFSGSGKSTVSANLAMQIARRGTPVIVFPTEMCEQWLTRAACALSRFPQHLAEKGLYRQATPQQRTFLRTALEEMREYPWEMVNRPNVTPAEILAAIRVLRRQWKGRTVVVVIDHMHRLDYGAEEADKEAGKATRALKNFAKEDRDGLVFLCLYQPKKPEQDSAMYQPVYASRIRGHSSVWNELDVHLSVYRTWGERSPYGRTEWGDDAVNLRGDGSPAIARPFSEGAVLNTEHTFLKPDKRRVGGEGPPLWLNIHKPSGQVFEASRRDHLHAL